MRRLRVLCERADLVTCLDDAVNYLLDADELHDALTGMRRNLRPGGLLVFDVNTLATYRSVFCDGFSWSGTDTYVSVGEPRAVEPGGLFATTLQAWRAGKLLAESRHVQRHHGTRSSTRAPRAPGWKRSPCTAAPPTGRRGARPTRSCTRSPWWSRGGHRNPMRERR